MEIGDRIRRARTRAKMTQRQFAKKLGVSYGLVGAWETDRKKPGRDNLAKIAEVTLTDIHELLGESTQQSRGVYVKDEKLLMLLRASLGLSDRQRQNLLELLNVASDVAREIEHQSEPSK